MVFQNLKLLKLHQCPELRKLWCSHGELGVFGNLKILTVQKCDFSSKVLLPLNLLKALANLEKLEVRECHSLEALIELPHMNEGRLMEKVTIHLVTIDISYLRELKHIWKLHSQEIVNLESFGQVWNFTSLFKSYIPHKYMKIVLHLSSNLVTDN